MISINQENFLMEWSVLNDEDPNIIKLYVEEIDNVNYLFLLTKKNALGLEDFVGYEIGLSVDHLQQLTTEYAWNYYLQQKGGCV